MRALSDSRPLRLLVFTALYFAQGLPWGFISVGYVVFLTDLGLDNTAIGKALAVAYLPWSFKIVAGTLLDRLPNSRFGRRRPIIIGAQLAMGATLLLLLGVDPASQQGLVSIVLFVHNAVAALQDVAVDALAVELLQPDERGRANSFMWAGKSAGIALGGGGGTVLAKYLGWSSLFVVLALAIWLVMLLPIFLRERPVAAPTPTEGRFDWPTLKRSFGFWTPWAGILVGLVTPVGYAIVAVPYLRLLRADFELTEEQIGLLSGIVEPVAGIVGALLGGLLADRFGARRAMAGGLLVVAASLGAFALSNAWWPPSMGFLVAYTLVLTLGTYAYNAASLGFFMGLTNPAIAATQFAGYMAVTNLTYAWTSAAGGYLADRSGIVTLFAVAAVAQVVVLAVLPLANPAGVEGRYRAVGAVPVVERAPAG